MRKIPNNAFELFARSIHNEIRIFYDDPKNKREFEVWKRERLKSRTSDCK